METLPAVGDQLPDLLDLPCLLPEPPLLTAGPWTQFPGGSFAHRFAVSWFIK